MTEDNDQSSHRKGGPESEGTGQSGKGRTDDTGVGPRNAAENINPGSTGAGTPDPVRPDRET
jgi:hypothetical protein